MKENLPIRKNMRLKYYDYTEQGMYFITICIKNRLELLGKINEENKIQLTEEGKIVKKYLIKINNIFSKVIIDEYVIMPNHIHFIIVIKKQTDIDISRIIKQYKMYVSKKIGYSIWQKSYYDHIIRNDKEFYAIKQYIQNNIANWKKNKYC